MTHFEDIGKLKELCQRLGEGDAIASRPELPKLFQILAQIIERQQDELESLKAKLGKLNQPGTATAAGAVSTEHHLYDPVGDVECPPRR